MHEGHIYYIVQLITVGLNSTYFCVKKKPISVILTCVNLLLSVRESTLIFLDGHPPNHRLFNEDGDEIVDDQFGWTNLSM